MLDGERVRSNCKPTTTRTAAETMAVLELSVGSYVVVVECSNVGGLTF